MFCALYFNCYERTNRARMKFRVLLQRFFYVTYETLTMKFYMNSTPWTYLWWFGMFTLDNIKILCLYYLHSQWMCGKLSLLCVFGGGTGRNTIWSGGKNYVSCLLGHAIAQAVTGLSSQRCRSEPMPVHSGWMKWHWGRFSVELFSPPPITITRPVLHALFHLPLMLYNLRNWQHC
jgi:hypothetical protein